MPARVVASDERHAVAVPLRPPKAILRRTPPEEQSGSWNERMSTLTPFILSRFFHKLILWPTLGGRLIWLYAIDLFYLPCMTQCSRVISSGPVYLTAATGRVLLYANLVSNAN